MGSRFVAVTIDMSMVAIGVMSEQSNTKASGTHTIRSTVILVLKPKYFERDPPTPTIPWKEAWRFHALHCCIVVH